MKLKVLIDHIENKNRVSRKFDISKKDKAGFVLGNRTNNPVSALDKLIF